MIGKLTGTIDVADVDHVILDVNGVGYVVSCSARTLDRIGGRGSHVSLRIDTRVREDDITLYGFYDAAEQAWFRLLTTVQGVGARVALAILSVMTPDGLNLAIASADKAPLTQADGVGPKLATRILTELKDKVAKLSLPATATPSPTTDSTRSPVLQDAVSALVNLGYGRSEAHAAVVKVLHDRGDLSLAEAIRIGLATLTTPEVESA